jgi:hypothetical protein
MGLLVAPDLGQATKAVTLKTAVQRRAREARDRGLKRVKAVVQGQQRVPAEGGNDRPLDCRQHRRARLTRAGREVRLLEGPERLVASLFLAALQFIP